MKKETKRGRPVKNTMPESIPDTPENIARALLTTPPKKKMSGTISRNASYRARRYFAGSRKKTNESRLGN